MTDLTHSISSCATRETFWALPSTGEVGWFATNQGVKEGTRHVELRRVKF